MAERETPLAREPKQPKYRRVPGIAALAFKVLVEMIGAAAALIAILQAFRMGP